MSYQIFDTTERKKMKDFPLWIKEWKTIIVSRFLFLNAEHKLYTQSCNYFKLVWRMKMIDSVIWRFKRRDMDWISESKLLDHYYEATVFIIKQALKNEKWNICFREDLFCVCSGSHKLINVRSSRQHERQLLSSYYKDHLEYHFSRKFNRKKQSC